MLKWKVKTDKRGTVHILKSADGNFHTLEEAQVIAKKIAQDNKTIMKVHTPKGIDPEATVDYSSMLSVNEIISKQISEVKIAKAELMVAYADINKQKNVYKDACADLKFEYKRKRSDSKDRIKKAKINLKNAKCKLKEIKDFNGE